MTSLLAHFQAIGEKEKSEAVREIIRRSTPDFDYFFMLVLSVMMATFGLLAGSEAVVIGAMLLAPLLAPIMGLALGTSMSHHPLIVRSLSTIAWSIVIAVSAAIVGSFLFTAGNLEMGVNDIITSRTEPSLLYFVVAVISGMAVAYTTVRPNLSSTLPGVAIAVALIPPLAVLGIGISHLSPSVIAGATVMFLINVAGMVFAGMLMYSLMDVHQKTLIAEKTIKKEEQRVESEAEKEKRIAEATKKELST